MAFFANLFEHEWELTKSPGGAHQWVAKDAPADVPDAHDPARTHRPTMLTTDLSLRFDPVYAPISRRFYENPEQFSRAFAESWYKLTHRDMGPHTRLIGAEVPPEPRLWQDSVPEVPRSVIGRTEFAELKQALLQSGLSVASLIKAAWAAASSYRGADKRGGSNGARIRLAPQRDWAVNEPEALGNALKHLEAVAAKFNASHERQVSLADLIVLGGCAAAARRSRRQR